MEGWTVLIFKQTAPYMWRCSGLVVSASDFEPEGQCFEPGLYCCVSTLSLSTQVYKWVPAT